MADETTLLLLNANCFKLNFEFYNFYFLKFVIIEFNLHLHDFKYIFKKKKTNITLKFKLRL